MPNKKVIRKTGKRTTCRHCKGQMPKGGGYNQYCSIECKEKSGARCDTCGGKIGTQTPAKSVFCKTCREMHIKANEALLETRLSTIPKSVRAFLRTVKPTNHH